MNKKALSISVLVIITLFLLGSISEFFMDFHWFKHYSQLETFWTLFFSKFNIHIIFSVIFCAMFMLNFLLIKLLGGKSRIFTANILNSIKLPEITTPRKMLFIILISILLVVSYFMGSIASSYWKEILIYFNQPLESVFIQDPIFNFSPEFYMFSLPFYQFIYSWLIGSFFVILLFSIVFHFLNNGIFIENNKLNFSHFSRSHLSTLLAFVVIIYGVGYKLSAFEILFSQRGKFFGAGYTATHTQLFAYNACFIISIVAALLLFFNIFKKSFKLPLILIGTIIPVYIILGSVIPALQQRFFVLPNELDMEKPYIQHNIKYTQLAYGLNNITEKKFSNNENLSQQDIYKTDILRNARLWDWKPLRQTYKQLQELKPYYNFNDVDIDRYVIDGKIAAVNISARELDISKLNQNSQTWINKHLIYTHGYGVVMSRVDKITPEGLPEMIIKNIPPITPENIKIDRPEIYYGEHDNDYIITNTTIQPGEFDYPSGDKNKYSTYNGDGGIKLDSFFKKLLFAFSLKEINILISGNINDESKIHYNRNIIQMVRKLSPFIIEDYDPYVVIENGKTYWMIDGYSVSDKFPYSTPSSFDFTKNGYRFNYQRFNYIRNSVKIVVDAYNGDISYYIIDKKDPVVKTYKKIFPTLFKDIKDMPASLKNHIRYPETMIDIQSKVLLRYHMKDINVFYNNEDAWELPKQIYENQQEIMSSYYIVTTLPGESKNEFIIMMPFTPIKKDNMIAFIVAKCDQENYGDITLYSLPKEKLSYGPMQLEARINQDAEISKQLTLWSQKGSKVIRGNMMVIPVKESLIFIEPLYLKAETSEMPELKKVIISFADKIVMADNLEDAFQQLFSGFRFKAEEINRELTDVSNKDNQVIKTNARKALFHYMEAQKFLKIGDWSNYGKEQEKLKQLLEKMQ